MLNCFIKSVGDIRTREFRLVLIASAVYSLVSAFFLWLLILLVLKIDDFSITGLDWLVDTLGSLAAVIILVLRFIENKFNKRNWTIEELNYNKIV